MKNVKKILSESFADSTVRSLMNGTRPFFSDKQIEVLQKAKKHKVSIEALIEMSVKRK